MAWSADDVADVPAGVTTITSTVPEPRRARERNLGGRIAQEARDLRGAEVDGRRA